MTDPSQLPPSVLRRVVDKLRRPGRAGGKMPFVPQLERTGCGAACLAMVCRFHGRDVPQRILREQLGIGRDGATAGRIAAVAREHGLSARGVAVEIEELSLLPRGAILHWGFRHFVVLDRVRADAIDIVDPAVGPRRVPISRVRREFTGVAVLAEPCAPFVPPKRGESSLKNYLRQLLSERRMISRSVVLSVVLRVFALGGPLLTAVVVDQVVPRADGSLLTTVMIGLALVYAFRWLANVARAHMLLQLRTSLDVRLTLGFIQRLVRLPFAFFQRHTTGDLLTRIASNGAIREVLSSTTLSAILDGSFAVVYLALIFANETTLGLIATGLGIAQGLAFWLIRRRVADLHREAIEARTASSGYMVQALAGMETLKSAGAEQRAVDKWSGLFADELEVGVRSGRLIATHAATMDVLTSASPLVLLAYGATAVMDGTLGLGTMLALQSLSVGFLTPLSSLVRSALSLQELGGHLERIDDVLQTPPQQKAGVSRRDLVPSGAIAVQGVCFRYSDEGPYAVQDVSLRIPAGTSVAIVGRSGSGKSTLAKLLLGLYAPESGTIRYDDCDLREVDHTRLRNRIGVVPQNPFIFDGTVRDNIALADPEASMDAIVAAAQAAAIHEEISAMPMGYQTLVSEGGSSISGGQRLRLALARALLHDPRVVVLDEATSQVDQRAERSIMEHLEAMKCTRIMIAHRLSTIAFADRIVVMEEGRVVETGTHDDLMARLGPYFHLVTSSQDERHGEHGVYRDHSA